MSWARSFDDSIPTPKDKPLLTLKDAVAYIMAATKERGEHPEWQPAIESLKLIPTLGGPTMLRALNRHVVREFNLSRKESPYPAERKLNRDQ
jgi:hypothetical protein